MGKIRVDYMKRAEPGNIIKFNGQLVKVIGTMTGKVIHMRTIDLLEEQDFYFLEDSKIFQEGAEPVETLAT